MAEVKSVTIHDDFANGNKRERRYKVTITTNSLVDEVYILSPVVVDASDDGSIFGAKKLASLADIEFNSSSTAPPEYQSQQSYDQKALSHAMLIVDVDDFHQFLPLFLDMTGRGGANANQRAEYMGTSRDTYDEIAGRFNDDQGVAFFLDNAKGMVWEELPPEFE